MMGPGVQGSQHGIQLDQLNDALFLAIFSLAIQKLLWDRGPKDSNVSIREDAYSASTSNVSASIVL